MNGRWPILESLAYTWQPLGVAYFAAAAILLIAGGGVLLYERFTEPSRRFFVLVGIIGGWLSTLGLAILAADPATELLWLRATWVIDPFTPPALFWLIQSLTGKSRRGVQLGLWVSAVLFGALSFQGPWLVEGLETATRGLTLSGWGWLGVLYFAYVAVSVALSVRELAESAWRANTVVDRWERIGLLAAALIGAFVLLEYWLPTSTYRAGPITPFALLAGALVVGWTALRYRIFSVTRTFGTGEVLNSMSDGVLLLDGEGRIRGANWAAYALLGRTEDEVQGRTASEYLRTRDGDEGWLPEPGETIRDRELRVRTSSGNRIAVSVAAEPMRTRGSRHAGTIVVARDIRERLAAERALEVQRGYYADLFDNIPEAIVLVDEQDRILRVNEEFTNLFGYTAADAVGASIDDLIVPEDRREESRELARAVASSGEPLASETVRRRKDGTRVDVSALSRRLEIPGEPVQLYAIYRDITERKAAERKLKEREEELRHAQKMEAVGTLAGGIAHDFNNLVTVINGHARFALDSLGDPEEVRRDLEEIERAGARAARLTQQLLAYGSRQVLRPRLLDVNEVLEDVEQELAGIIEGDIRIEARPCPRGCHVSADRSQLVQVVMNLATNAREAMPDGGVLTLQTGAVTLDAEDPAIEGWELEPGPYVRIVVADTGRGMDQDTLEHVFDPFFTSKEKAKGTGLGLSTVFGIVKQSGGHVVAESEPGVGSRFTVYLPAAEAFAAAEAAPGHGGEDAPARAAQTPGSPVLAPEAAPDAVRARTVLVAEDEAGVRKMVARVLERAGHAVLTAADGEAALAAIDEYGAPVDLVVTDMVMPTMGGRELAERLRARWPAQPILFISGYDEALVTEAGDAAEFLAKPFTPAELARRVAEILAPRQDHNLV